MEKFDKALRNGRARILLFVCVSAIVAAPTYFLGVYDGPDIPQHFQFADTYERAILSGDLYPSWAAYENLGYGSVGSRFYPPLFSFMLALAHLLINDWHIALCLVFLLFTFIGSVGAYFLAKEFMKPERAFWAGTIFALMPYHISQIYNISVYAEFAGCSFLPFAFLFVTRICRRGALGDAIGLAVSYAALILTHLPSTVTGSICLLLYGLAMVSKQKVWNTLLKLAVGGTLGLLASSAYWLKVVTERGWMQHTTFHTEQVFDYKYNFLLTSNFLDGGPYLLLNAVLITTTLMVAFALWGLYSNKDFRLLRQLRGLVLLFAVSVFMTLKVSQPLWEIFPFIQTIQFPFRWLTISVAAGAAIIAAGIHPLYDLSLRSPDHHLWVKRGTALSASALILVSIATWTNASYSLPYDTFEEWVAEKKASKGLDFWWTTITTKEAFDITDKVNAESRLLTISQWLPYERNFVIEAGPATDARVATLFYPHWRARVNGNPTNVFPDENGAILIPVSEDRSVVSLYFQEPPLITAGLLSSTLTWLFLIAAIPIWILVSQLIQKTRINPQFFLSPNE